MVFGFLLGLTVGSFVNVCIDRLPLRFTDEVDHDRLLNNPALALVLKTHIRNRTLAPWRPARSFCFACGHQLSFQELIPVFSFLFDGGRCRECSQRYSARSLWVELSHGIWYTAVFTAVSGSWLTGLVCINFSFLWILGYCHACPVLGGVLKRTGIMLLIVDGITGGLQII